MKLRMSLLVVFTLLALPVSVLARGPAGPWPPPDRLTGPPLPEGLTADEWASIQEQIRRDLEDTGPAFGVGPHFGVTPMTTLYGDRGADFGFSMDVDGDTLVVGEPGAGGEAYVFMLDVSGVWDRVAEMTIPSEDFNLWAWFGGSVAVDGDTIVIGAPYAGGGSPPGAYMESPSGALDGCGQCGVVYVYEGSVGNWAQTARFPPPVVELAEFGRSVDIEGDIIAVGAPGVNDDEGQVYIYERGGGGDWTQTVTIPPPDPSEHPYFGHGVILSNDTLIVAATGAIYIFEHTQGAWNRVASLINGYHGSPLSAPLSFDGNRLAFAVIPATSGSSHVYIYGRDQSGNWSEQAALSFEYADLRPSIAGDALAVGKFPFSSHSASPNPGAASSSDNVITFERDLEGNWNQTDSFTIPDLSSMGEGILLTDEWLFADGLSAQHDVVYVYKKGLVVNSTGDSEDLFSGDGVCDTGNTIVRNGQQEAECTLRAALQGANITPGLSAITFDIPDASIPVINLQSPLPQVTGPVVIDATTQPGGGMVRLDGDALGGEAAGLDIAAGPSTIRGLIITRFPGHGISLDTEDSCLIEHNYIGTDPGGTPGLGNGGVGVMVKSGSGHKISQNGMADNGGLGIDLEPAGPTPNDTMSDPECPEEGDQDTGVNQLQNWPFLAGAWISDTLLMVNFKVDTHPSNAAYPLQVEFYIADDTADGAEGETYLGSLAYTLDQAQTFVVEGFEPEEMPAIGTPIVALAIDAEGNTSEFTYRPVLVSERGGGLVFKVDNAGYVYADGTYSSSSARFAERWPLAKGAWRKKHGEPEAGEVLALGPDGGVMPAGLPGAGRVVGVYVAQPGFLGGGPTGVPVALVGVVPVRVSAERGAIRPGDLLTVSSTPGVAARAEPVVVGGKRFYLPGTFFGKALEPFDGPGVGVIRVLLLGR